MKKLFLFLILAKLYTLAHSQSCESRRYIDEVFTARIQSDILYASADPYGIISAQDLRLDIYEPDGDTLTKRPLIIYAFGGAFLIGDKIQPDIPTYCNHFAKQGFVVASINYRIGFNTLSTGSAIRAVYRALQDLKAATRFLCENRDVYGIDTNYIFYSGSSAGCIAGLENAFLTEADRPAETYGSMVFLEPEDLLCSECAGNTLFGSRTPKPAGIISRWGAVLDTNQITNIITDSVPVISFHGTADNAVPYEMGTPFSYPIFPTVYGSASIHERLKHLGIYNQLVPLVGAGHEPELLNMNWDDTIFKYCTPFLLQILQPKTSEINGMITSCIGDTVTYVVSNHIASHYCWNIDSGGIIVADSNNKINVIWSTYGSHQVSAMELNAIGCSGIEKTKTVNIIAYPIANFTDSTYHNVVFLSNASSAGITYLWTFGDGNISTLSSPIHAYADSGWYTVKLETNNGACIDDTIIAIHVSKCPHANFNYSVFYNTVYASNLSSYGSQYLWDFGDGSTDTVKQPNHTYTTAGTYTIMLIVSNDDCMDTMYQTVSIIANGVIEASEQNFSWSILPNPFQSSFIINGPKSSRMSFDVCIYNISNQLILNIKDYQLSSPIQMSEMPDGAYFIKLSNAEYLKYFKLMKQE